MRNIHGRLGEWAGGDPVGGRVGIGLTPEVFVDRVVVSWLSGLSGTIALNMSHAKRAAAAFMSVPHAALTTRFPGIGSRVTTRKRAQIGFLERYEAL